jgi:PAS domain-containing protein
MEDNKTNIDINEFKRAEKKLKDQNALLSAIINCAKDTLIFALDKKYRYLAFNKNHLQEMKKVYNANIEIGQCMLDYISIPEIKPLAKASFDRVLGGESFIETQRQPNLNIWYEFNWNPIKQSDGQIFGINVYIRDITERKMMEVEKEKQTEELKKINELMVDRELKMVEMKEEIGNLKEEVKLLKKL